MAEILRSQGELSAEEVRAAVGRPLSLSAVRTMLRRLEEKGIVRRRREGRRDIFALAASERDRREAALRRISREYFDGSMSAAAVTLIEILETQHPGAMRALQPRLRAVYRRCRPGAGVRRRT